MKIIFKKRLYLQGNRLLGSLIYFLDSKDRPCLKISFKNKVGGAKMWSKDRFTDTETELANDFQDLSLDVSYKFQDGLLELKREVPGNKPERKFLLVPQPPTSYLFLVRINDLEILNIATLAEDHLVLEPPVTTKQVAVFFSFAGADGRPLLPDEYANDYGKSIIQEIPHEKPYDKIWIGIVEDTPHTYPFNLLIKIPEYKKI
jgi:hypothetical protein